MKTVEQLAREAGLHIYPEYSAAFQRFHDAAIAQYRESLLAGVGEPVAWRVRWPAMGGGYKGVMNEKPVMQADGFVNERLFNADQMAAAAAIEREKCVQECVKLQEFYESEAAQLDQATLSEAFREGEATGAEACAAAIRGQR